MGAARKSEGRWRLINGGEKDILAQSRKVRQRSREGGKGKGKKKKTRSATQIMP